MKKKFRGKRKKTASAPIESAPSKPTATFYQDQITGHENLSVGSACKVEIEGRVVSEDIDIYAKPQKKSFRIQITKAKVIGD